ncbi:MAG TPA: pyruvate kinase, partial [Thermoanaerobaculia bacterium]
MERRAKIVATLGPASTREEVLRDLIRAGLDLVRLNLSHGTHEEHGRTIQLVRRMGNEERVHIPIVVDLMGPRYRLGTIPGEARMLLAGELVVLGNEADGTKGIDLPVDSGILEHLSPGERVLIDSGLLELRVEAKEGGRVRARVINGGTVRTRKGINLPDTSLPFEISDKDRDDVLFAIAEGAEYLAASYVGEASH